MKKATIRVSILRYLEEERCFSPDPFFRLVEPDDDDIQEDPLSMDEVELLGISLSKDWMKAYKQWNNFNDENSPNGFTTRGHPHFSSIEDVNEFNETGTKLVKGLRMMLRDRQDVEIESFQPLYSNIQVGDSVAGWWHVKDMTYGCIVPIQELPVSDELKSRLMLWRKFKDANWFDEECRHSFNEEGHDIEEHLLWELNVRYLGDNSQMIQPTAPSTGTTTMPPTAATATDNPCRCTPSSPSNKKNPASLIDSSMAHTTATMGLAFFDRNIPVLG